MTQYEIIEMARRVGFGNYTYEALSMFQAFAELVAQHEREEIAQFIERTSLNSLPDETALHYAQLLKSYSNAIRARGEHD
jgi:hypothetical protein